MPSKKIFFDVGANDGSSSIHVAEKDSNCLVFAFEPTKKLYNELKEKTSHLKNYIVIPKAVSDFNGIEKFYIAGQADWGCSSLLKFSNKSKTEWPGRTDFVVTEEIYVDVIRLDDFMEENKISKIDFLHIDTQGSDLNVLKGLGDKIRFVSEGIMEAANKDEILYLNQNNKQESINFLENNGFNIVNIFPNDSEHNEVNIVFKKKIKIKKFIVTYNNPKSLNNSLSSIFNSLTNEELSLLEINIINNHTNFYLNEEFKDNRENSFSTLEHLVRQMVLIRSISNIEFRTSLNSQTNTPMATADKIKNSNIIVLYDIYELLSKSYPNTQILLLYKNNTVNIR